MGELKAHPEVVNVTPRVLIIGYGWVGQHIGAYFPDAHYVDIDGMVRRVSDGLPVERPATYALGFICVPTPPCEDGRCDTSIVEQAYRMWGARVRQFCIKSTVEVGTTERLGPEVCFSPEYIGETLGHPLREPQRDPFIILGGPQRVTEQFANAWTLVTNSNARIIQTDSRTAELCKLMENSWLAIKVMFCNEFYDLAQVAGVDWHTLRECWLQDPRITRSHTYVYPDNRGFGGKCLPKDTANLCHWAGGRARLIEFVRAYNEELRDGLYH